MSSLSVYISTNVTDTAATLLPPPLPPPLHPFCATSSVQPGDVAFQVPDNLVVPLERVLGDESIGEGWLGFKA